MARNYREYKEEQSRRKLLPDRLAPLEGRERRDRITFDEFRSQFAPINPDPGPHSPYVRDYQGIVQNFQPGDELEVYVSDKASWGRQMGMACVSHLRNGEVICNLVVRMN